MYAQVEKTKRNESRAAANSVAQKKGDVKQGFRFVDNREMIQLMIRRVGSTAFKGMRLFNVNLRNAWVNYSDRDCQVHSKKHAWEFGAKNPKEYAFMAREFIDKEDPFTQTKTGKDGKKYFFNPKSNYFAVVNKQGKISTFFKPDPAKHGKESNQKYFDSK